MTHDIERTTILAAVDLSELTDVVIDQAILHAAKQGAALHVLHVVAASPPATTDTAYPRRAPDFQRQEHQLLAKVGERLELIATESPTEIMAHVRSGPTADEIVELAAELDSDLLVVGNHGRTGLGRLVLGSVSEKVVRTATCPVLVVREKEHSTPEIERPCPLCVITRRETGGRELWCEQHRHVLGRRHTYHFVSRNVAARENEPLVVHSRASSEPLRH
jgi:nucleotide-binding universal stress UspA family protein